MFSEIKGFNKSFSLDFFACSAHTTEEMKINQNKRSKSYRTEVRVAKA